MGDCIFYFAWGFIYILAIFVGLVLLMVPNHPSCIGYCYGDEEFKIHWYSKEDLK